jgi:hypothetical protein
MKYPTIIRRLALLPAVLVALTLTPATTFAQLGNGSPAKGMNAAMMKLFGSNNSFSSKAEIRLLDKAGKASTVIPMGFTMLDGKMRMDIDLTQIKSSDMPPNAIPMMKQMGMDTMIAIKRPDKKQDLIIYPGLKSYLESPSSKEEIADTAKNYKIDKTKIGKETIDGHPADKNKVVMTDDKGQKTEATTWNATDLKDFPVQIQMAEDGENVVVKFSDVKLAKPAPTQFEVPAGLARYTNQQQLLQVAASKMIGPNGAAAGQK